MSAHSSPRGLSVPDMEVILAVTSKLAAPFDLMTMLSEVVNAAKRVLHADRGSVWLYDPATDELVLEIATGIAPRSSRVQMSCFGAHLGAESICQRPEPGR